MATVNMKQPSVLKLNSNWQAIELLSPEDALCALCNDETARVINVEYPLNSDGTWDFSQPAMSEVKFSEWLDLPIRPGLDMVLNSGTNRPIRLPTIIIVKTYCKMPLRHFKATKAAIYRRDQGRCQYTGKIVPKDKGNIDHIIPVSKGGKNVPENMVWTSRDINSRKGNKSNADAGLSLIRPAVKPKPITATQYLKELLGDKVLHNDWIHFLA